MNEELFGSFGGVQMNISGSQSYRHVSNEWSDMYTRRVDQISAKMLDDAQKDWVQPITLKSCSEERIISINQTIER